MSENKAYIAVPVDKDGVTVWDDHFGEAPQFYIYDRGGALVTQRANPHWQDDHDFHTGPARMVDLLPECGVFIARHMGNGRHVLAERFGVQSTITTETTVEAALRAYLAEA
jgi:predicted Fe-Mo cluster-binding NifX family protein